MLKGRYSFHSAWLAARDGYISFAPAFLPEMAVEVLPIAVPAARPASHRTQVAFVMTLVHVVHVALVIVQREI